MRQVPAAWRVLRCVRCVRCARPAACALVGSSPRRLLSAPRPPTRPARCGPDAPPAAAPGCSADRAGASLSRVRPAWSRAGERNCWLTAPRPQRLGPHGGGRWHLPSAHAACAAEPNAGARTFSRRSLHLAASRAAAAIPVPARPRYSCTTVGRCPMLGEFRVAVDTNRRHGTIRDRIEKQKA